MRRLLDTKDEPQGQLGAPEPQHGVQMKVWKKTMNSKVQKTHRQNSKDGTRMDIEMENKSSNDYEDDRPEMRCEKMDLESNDPMQTVKGIINCLEATCSPHTQSFNSDMELENQVFKSNQHQYDTAYGKSYVESLRKNTPSLDRFLDSTQVQEGLRAKMVDWMQEVFNFFKPESDDFTFFKALTIMDLFLKHNQRGASSKIQDCDVHLIGLTAIFIASKYEDNRHITIDQLIQNACRGKFKTDHILKMEWEILMALGFNTSMPTHLEWLDAMLNDSFEDTNGEFFHRIRYWAIYMLKTAMYFPTLVGCPMQTLSLACIIYSIHSNFDSETVRLIKQKDANLNLVVLEKHTLVVLYLTEGGIPNPKKLQESRRTGISEHSARLCKSQL